MILELKGADFSENNIGKITLGLSEKALAVIEASGNTSLTFRQKAAINTFLDMIGANEVGDSTIFSKLQYLYLPIICNDVTKSLYNYKTMHLDYEISSDKYALRNHGIVNTDDVNSPIRITTSPQQVLVDDMSCVWLRNELFTEDDINTNCGLFCTFGNNICYLFTENVNSNRLITLSSYRSMVKKTYDTVLSSTSLNDDEVRTKGFSSNGENVYVNVHGDKVSHDFTDSPYNDSAQSEIWLFQQTQNLKKPCGILSIGHFLTENELQTMCEACNVLKDAFLVAD